jgi:hypothetical protein
MQKSKNLLALPSVIVISLLTILTTVDRIADEAIANGGLSTKHKKDIIVCVLTAALSAYLRHTEDDSVYTPLGIVGRDKPESED